MPRIGHGMKKKSCIAPSIIHEGNKEDDGEGKVLCAALKISVVYSALDPSLYATVYTSGREYIGKPMTVAIEGGE
jgi:hypothetical protein